MSSACPPAHDAAGLIDPLLLNLRDGVGSHRALIGVAFLDAFLEGINWELLLSTVVFYSLGKKGTAFCR